LSGVSDPAARFKEIFGAAPSHLSRAPGRVNVIGEHTDYNGLPVLPMAIQREVRIALVPRDDGLVRLHNTASEFEPIEFEIQPGLERHADGSWINYVMGPAHELARRFAIWRGFDGVLASDVPVASGLSSSTALANAVGVALASINEVVVDPLAFAGLMSDAEHFTGTRGGQMDQAISLGARAGFAAKITFSPLRMRHVPIPEDWCFVVADTGVRAEKSGAAQSAYNARRAECEEAFAAVAAQVRRSRMSSRVPSSYAGLLRMVGWDGALAAGEAALSGNLLRRFRHVITEADRVNEAADRMLSADLMGLGTLMDASHGSLRTDYHVSSAELDELVMIAREGGAAGARLTGAGFGGCIVALADRGSIGGVIDTLVTEYFEPRGMTDRIDDRLFVAVPSAGASFGPVLA